MDCYLDRVHTFGNFGKIPALDIVIRFEEYRTKTGFTDRVILEVEFIKTVEGISVCLKRC